MPTEPGAVIVYIRDGGPKLKSSAGVLAMATHDHNAIIAKIEDAKTSIEELRSEDESPDRKALLDDVEDALDQATEALEEEPDS